jgi:3-oxoacyl-[acyl-carrier-protein] synthase III
MVSLGHAVPTRVVTNADLVARAAERSSGSLGEGDVLAICSYLSEQLDRTGARTRYHRLEGEDALGLGIRAAKAALDAAGLQPTDVDLLIYTGVGRGFIEPATANVFQAALGMTNATCFDLLDACASWIRAVDVASHLVAAGRYRRTMILNCEANFREYEPASIASPGDMELLWAGFTVGEAATATIIDAGDGDAQYHATFRNAGAYVQDCQIPLPHAGQFLNGNPGSHLPALLFQSRPDVLAAGAIRQLHRQFQEDPLLSKQRYDVIFGHTVSVPVTDAVLRRLELDPARFVEIYPSYGNVVSASLPLAMSLAMSDGRLRRGNRVLLMMGGAGLTTALASFVF